MNLQYIISPNSDRNPLLGAKGVTIEGDLVTFGEGWTEGKAKALLDLTEPSKQASFEITKKRFEPDTEDKRILSDGLGIEEKDFDKLEFIQIRAANTRLDRHDDRFTPAFLQKLADIANVEYTSLVNLHDGRGGIYGRAFRSFTEMDTEGVTWLIQKSYVFKAATLPNGVSVEDALATKLIRHTSISFGARAEYKELPNGNYYGLYDYKEGDRVEFIHNAFVELGAQIGALIEKNYKSFDPGNEPGNGNATKGKEKQPIKKVTHMITFNSKAFEGEDPTKELLAEANTVLKELTELKATLPELKAAKEAMDTLRTKAIEAIKVKQGKDGLNLPTVDQWDESDFAAKSLEKLMEKAEALTVAFEDSNIEGQTAKGATGNGQKSSLYIDKGQKITNY